MEWLFCYGIGNCSYSSGISTRIALAILGVQCASFALFYAIRGEKQCVSFTVSIVYCIIRFIKSIVDMVRKIEKGLQVWYGKNE